MLGKIAALTCHSCHKQYRVVQKFASFLYALTASKILTDFKNSFTVRFQRKFAITLSDPTTSQVCRYTTLCLVKTQQRGVSLIALLLNGVVGLSASSSSKADTLNIDVKTARYHSYFGQ